jgi:hypothetical protein
VEAPVDTCPPSATLLLQLQAVLVVVVVRRRLLVLMSAVSPEQLVRETVVGTDLPGTVHIRDPVVVVVLVVPVLRQTPQLEHLVQVELEKPAVSPVL